MDDVQKRALYAEAGNEIAAVIEGERDRTARMVTVSNILHHKFDYFFWTGFYVVDPVRPDELVVGPYQGTLGCLRIPFGKGVCGAAAMRAVPVIVDDVHDFPGHIACDPNSKSEVVVPVFDGEDNLIAVLDVDSDVVGAFDGVDAEELARIVSASFSA